jgi:hypothetical protein
MLPVASVLNSGRRRQSLMSFDGGSHIIATGITAGKLFTLMGPWFNCIHAFVCVFVVFNLQLIILSVRFPSK